MGIKINTIRCCEDWKDLGEVICISEVVFLRLELKSECAELWIAQEILDWILWMACNDVH